MKKLLIYVFFVFVTGFSAYFGYYVVQSSRYDGPAGLYIQEVLPVISEWNPDTIKRYMAPEIATTISTEELAALMRALAKIGSLQSIGKVSFKSKSTVDNIQHDKYPIITYEVDAQYSSGNAKVIISMLDRDSSYDLYNFNFQSKALAP